jgi:hypothetical protein
VIGIAVLAYSNPIEGSAPSAGFARAILFWGEAARSEPEASDERRKGGV